jgi:hypothetical protein
MAIVWCTLVMNAMRLFILTTCRYATTGRSLKVLSGNKTVFDYAIETAFDEGKI